MEFLLLVLFLEKYLSNLTWSFRKRFKNVCAHICHQRHQILQYNVRDLNIKSNIFEKIIQLVSLKFKMIKLF